MRRLLLFDIDGTLIRMKDRISRTVVYGVFGRIFGIEIPENHPADFAGKTDTQIYRELTDAFGIANDHAHEQASAFHTLLTGELVGYCTTEWVQLLPGVNLLLEELSQEESVTLGLLTGNIRECAYLKLSPHQLGNYFPFGAFGCDHHQRNMLPPVAIGRANAFLGHAAFTPENTVIIGDSLRDIDCAKAHGLSVLAVATGGTSAEVLERYGADHVVPDLTDNSTRPFLFS